VAREETGYVLDENPSGSNSVDDAGELEEEAGAVAGESGAFPATERSWQGNPPQRRSIHEPLVGSNWCSLMSHHLPKRNRAFLLWSRRL
jgi:hypothetical protein